MTSRVLVVEDNAELAENIAELLEPLDVEPVLLETAECALAEAKRGFALALVDVGLPGTSGVEVLARLKDADPDSEVVLMTGNGTLESAIDAVRHGAFAYLLKPFEPDAMIAMCERALAQVSLRSERRSLAKALGESEALYRSVVESVDSLIVALDAEGTILFCNRFAAETYGADPVDVYGEPFVTICADDDEHVARAMRDALGGATITDLPATLQTRRGTKRELVWSFTRVGGSRNIALIAVGLDVTEQRELQRRNAEAQAMAAIGVLTAGLAHEIRNPLNAASLQLQLLSRQARKLDAEQAKKVDAKVELVRGELGRLSKMLNDFLGLARPTKANRETFALAALLDDILALEAPLCAESGVTLVHAVDPSLLVRADRAGLQQVFVNLIHNARDAIEGEGTIRVEAKPKGDRAHVRVLDDGPGLPVARGDVLEPFFTTKAAGTGLGLAIVQKILALHGSEITLRNRVSGSPEKGAAASFWLPLASTP